MSPRRRTGHLPLRSELARQRAFDALYRMRADGWSLTRAARDAYTDPRPVQRYVGSALRRSPSGRVEAKPTDRLVRHVNVIATAGIETGTVKSNRDAELLGAHADAVRRFLLLGDSGRLRKFHGITVRLSGRPVTLQTDERALKRRANAGEIYRELYLYRG